MVFLKHFFSFLRMTFSWAHLQDCNRGDIYARAAAYRHNRNERPVLLKRILYTWIVISVLMLLGMLGETLQWAWLYAPAYVLFTLAFLQIPILSYGYFYLTKWPQWNSN